MISTNLVSNQRYHLLREKLKIANAESSRDVSVTIAFVFYLNFGDNDTYNLILVIQSLKHVIIILLKVRKVSN